MRDRAPAEQCDAQAFRQLCAIVLRVSSVVLSGSYLLVYSRIRYHTLAAPDMEIVVAAAAADAASDVLGAGGIPRTNNSAAAFGGADFSA